MNIDFSNCYIVFPLKYNNEINIYKLDFIIDKVVNTSIGKSYTLKSNNLSFNILILDNDDNYKNKIYERKCYIDDESSNNNVDVIIFAFNKETIVNYYKNKLTDLKNILIQKQNSLINSINAVTEQQHLLNSNPDLYIKNYF